jgi:predicted AAA+ superfamily ATPase
MSQMGFSDATLPLAVAKYLHDTNPWWVGKPGRVLPRYRRWLFDLALKNLNKGLAPVLVLRGPRQVGKTTLQEQLVEHLLKEQGLQARRILRVQFDDLPSLRGVSEPVLAIARWFQAAILGETFNEAAHRGEPAFVFLDEAQNLPDWAPQVKALVDHSTVKVLLTGSSSLRIMAGQDSLAGRITQFDMGPLLLREIAALRFEAEVPPLLSGDGLEALARQDFWSEVRAHGRRYQVPRDQAFAALSERGGYPMAQANPDVPWPQIADQLNETVIQRAIQHDLRLGSRGMKRDANLLEEVFRLACRYAGQTPGRGIFLKELREALDADVGWQRVLQYLRFLDSAMLMKLVEPLELRLKGRKGDSKVCLCDHGLRASWLREVVPLDPSRLREDPHLADLAGHLAESVAGYFLSNIPHLDVNHFPPRGGEPEVDFVLTIGARRVPLEVKYRRRVDAHEDTRGLRAFLEKTVYNAPFGVLVTMLDDVEAPDPRIEVVSLSSLLLTR